VDLSDEEFLEHLTEQEAYGVPQYSLERWEFQRLLAMAKFERDDITLRDYFAGVALQGLQREVKVIPAAGAVEPILAQMAYRQAEAMLKEREKK